MKIKVEKLNFAYKNIASKKQHALCDINLTIDDHEFIAIIGPTGSGKTTLAQHIAGLLQPDSGAVWIDNININDEKKYFAAIRKHIGLVFQFPESQLFEETVFSDVAFGPRNLGLSVQEVANRVQRSLMQVGLNFHEIRTRSPHHLSEGEKRRVAIAGVLAMEPQVIALDEPTACLDPKSVAAIENILQGLYDAGKTVILISHNIDFVFKLAQRIIIIYDGKIAFDNTKQKLLEQEDLIESVGLHQPRIHTVLKRKNISIGKERKAIFSVNDILS